MRFSSLLYYALLVTILVGCLPATVPDELPTAKAKVLLFMDPECPISQRYTLTISGIQHDFADKGAAFIAIYSQKEVSEKIVDQFHREYGLSMNFWLDSEKHWARKYQATVTPEVVLLDSLNVVRYRGAIDNWYLQLGESRLAPDSLFLQDALDALLSKRALSITYRKPVGCYIEY